MMGWQISSASFIPIRALLPKGTVYLKHFGSSPDGRFVELLMPGANDRSATCALRTWISVGKGKWGAQFGQKYRQEISPVMTVRQGSMLYGCLLHKANYTNRKAIWIMRNLLKVLTYHVVHLKWSTCSRWLGWRTPVTLKSVLYVIRMLIHTVLRFL